jgi:sialate O-acetylesterase
MQRQPLKLACIGNSVTFGAGHKNPAQSAYPVQLQQWIGNDYAVKNFGVSGSTLLKKGHRPYHLQQAFADMLAWAPDIAVIHLGLNDTDPRNWPNFNSEFKADYSWLIDTIRKVNPAVKIYICRLSPISNEHPRFLSGTRDWYWQIQQQIEEIAKVNQTGLIDFHTPLYTRPELLPDGLHPNEEGATLLAKTVYQKITGDYGGLKLPVAFSSHMVMQRNKPIHFFGTANRHEKVDVLFNKEKQTAITNENGEWQVHFPAMQAGGPYSASISTTNTTLLLDDILIGEVWLCAGQSNMAFTLGNAMHDASEMQHAQQNNQLRFLNMHQAVETGNFAWDSSTLEKINDLQFISGNWQQSDSISAKQFSAVAYFFGKKLQEKLGVPVGLIQLAVGGSTTESWMDRFTMEHDPIMVHALHNWRKSDYYQPWVRERADINLKNSTNPKQRHPYEPCYNYEAGISHFTGFPIQGVIWYQGESNAHNVELHEHVFPNLVASWRKAWGYSFPFYYVQLSSLNRPSWPAFRYSQLQILKSIPNSGMAVSSDVGHPTDVHPANKNPVGERLAALALHFTYRKKNITPHGPMPLKAQLIDNHIEITFNYTGKNLATSDEKPLRGFTLRNQKGIETEVNAILQKRKVMIPVDKKDKPVEILYGWKPYTDANLINSDRLPASTFKLSIQEK